MTIKSDRCSVLRSEIVVDLDGDGVGKWGEVGKRVQTIHSEVNKICGSNVVNNCIVCLKFAKGRAYMFSAK